MSVVEESPGSERESSLARSHVLEGVQTGTVLNISAYHCTNILDINSRVEPPCLKPMRLDLDACDPRQTCTYLTFCSCVAPSSPPAR